MTRALLVVALLLVLPASALAARRLDRATAFRFAATAPLPRGGGVPSTPIRSLVVESCRKRSASAFVCSVSVRYQPVPSSTPGVQTSAPQCDYSVRVAYASARSRVPTARRVGAVTCPA